MLREILRVVVELADAPLIDSDPEVHPRRPVPSNGPGSPSDTGRRNHIRYPASPQRPRSWPNSANGNDLDPGACLAVWCQESWPFEARIEGADRTLLDVAPRASCRAHVRPPHPAGATPRMNRCTAPTADP